LKLSVTYLFLNFFILTLAAAGLENAEINMPEIARPACLSMVRTDKMSALPVLENVLKLTTDPDIFGTAVYALGQIKEPVSAALLIRYAGRFPHLSSCANALSGMDSVIIDILENPQDKYLSEAIEATNYLWTTVQREIFIPQLKDLILSAPAPLNKKALARLIDEFSRYELTLEKQELLNILDIIKDIPEFSDEKKYILSRFNAVIVPASLSTVVTPKNYGNTTAQEYGDAVYRVLNMPTYNYNHAGIFSGLDSSNTGMARVALGWDTPAAEVLFSESFTDYGTRYYGSYTLDNRILTFEDRRNIAKEARDIIDAFIFFPSGTVPICIEYYGPDFDGTVFDISGIRCDGMVEYCYEKYGFRIWRNKVYPDSLWSILKNPDNHNYKPGTERAPDTEMSPWAQRGAPCGTGPFPGESCGYPEPDTHLVRTSVISLPEYQVTQTNGEGYADVTILASDESGIHYIAYKKPDDTDWNRSPVQPQDPYSGSYSYTVRLIKSGYLYVFAMDNGGNFPSEANGYFIDIESAPHNGLLPERYSLSQNYPNPFNSATMIDFSIMKKDNVSLTVFNLLGKKIGILEDRVLTPGYYSIKWEPDNISSGLYFYQLSTSEFKDTKKLFLLK